MLQNLLSAAVVIGVLKVLLPIAPDKDWRQLGIYPPLFDLIGYFKF